MTEFLDMSSFKAAIGSVSLDIARERGFTGLHQEELGIQVNFGYFPVLTIANLIEVVSIIA